MRPRMMDERVDQRLRRCEDHIQFSQPENAFEEIGGAAVGALGQQIERHEVEQRHAEAGDFGVERPQVGRVEAAPRLEVVQNHEDDGDAPQGVDAVVTRLGQGGIRRPRP